jgi:hypothetical protein
MTTNSKYPNYHNHPKRFGCGTQTGQASKREYNRRRKLVLEGKACWWRKWMTIEELENTPL